MATSPDDPRSWLTPAQRSVDLHHTIDPGFVHHRKIQSLLGDKGMHIVDTLIERIPSGVPDWQRPVRIDHIYTAVLLRWCKAVDVPPLHELLATGKEGMFCSTDRYGPCLKIYQADRGSNAWRGPRGFKVKARLEYSTKLISGDTLRGRLHTGELFSIVGQARRVSASTYELEPLVMGFPWLEAGDTEVDFDPMWHGRDFFEHFVEDFDEFTKVDTVPLPADCSPMREISESAVKQCIAHLLGGEIANDWGGETSDFFSPHLHLRGRRLKAAFLLKGPARFAPMTLAHLGKNNDQIVRLSHEPADVLFVQHCHEIGTAVRQTLRAFAVQPSRPRRYCCVDGRESLRLLQAYGLWDKAVSISRAQLTSRRRKRSSRPA